MGRPPKDTIDPALREILQTIGGNLKQLRTEKNLSQSELAAAAKVSATTLNEMETRRFRDMRLSTLCAIAKALSVPILRLLSPSDVRMRQSDQAKLLRASEEILNITKKLRDHD